jgi:hypothetical protein
MSQPSLAEFQRWMKSRIRPEGAWPDVAASAMLNPQRGIAPEERLAVYAGGYVARTREALAEVYEAVRQVLGEPAFAEVAQAYADRFPSHEYNLSFAGRHLPELLIDSPYTRRLPFLPDLARLEWQVCRAFHAFEEPPLDPARLAAVPPDLWGRLRLSVQPSVGLIASAWPIRDIWAARRQPRETVNIEVQGRPQRVLVFRRGFEVTCELLEEPQAAVLAALLAGRTLEEAVGGVGGAAPRDVTEWFARWTRERLIVRAAPVSAVV